MKKITLVIVGLIMVAMLRHASAKVTGAPALSRPPVLSSSDESNKNFIRSESEISEGELAQMPFDAFLTESGYVVYPIEENCAVLQAKIEKNPMILHKVFIPRRVHVLRRVDGRSSDGSVKGVLGKQFVIVSEIGSVTQFMVDLKDLHFVQDKNVALNNPKPTTDEGEVSVAKAVGVSASLPVVEREEAWANTELGTTLINPVREPDVRLANLKGIAWAGVAMFLFGLASMFYPPLKMRIGRVRTGVAILFGSLSLMVLLTLIVENRSGFWSTLIRLDGRLPGEQVATPESSVKHKTRILFVCTGNYYRSRFAEAYLKFAIEKNKLPIETYSCGLATDVPRNSAVSPYVIAELTRRNIPESYASGLPTQITSSRLNSADIVVAMDRQEHQSRLQATFPQASDKVRYWDIKDHGCKPSTVCSNISEQVQALILELVGDSAGEPNLTLTMN